MGSSTGQTTNRLSTLSGLTLRRKVLVSGDCLLVEHEVTVRSKDTISCNPDKPGTMIPLKSSVIEELKSFSPDDWMVRPKGRFKASSDFFSSRLRQNILGAGHDPSKWKLNGLRVSLPSVRGPPRRLDQKMGTRRRWWLSFEVTSSSEPDSERDFVVDGEAFTNPDYGDQVGFNPSDSLAWVMLQRPIAEATGDGSGGYLKAGWEYIADGTHFPESVHQAFRDKGKNPSDYRFKGVSLRGKDGSLADTLSGSKQTIQASIWFQPRSKPLSSPYGPGSAVAVSTGKASHKPVGCREGNKGSQRP